jgi:2-keto-4-pentenoate hydratase/2-oxohepta-3-ene-1,7-dioic acid hydratase in catechol pathway
MGQSGQENFFKENGMILLTFRQHGKEFLGVKTSAGILDVAAANQALRTAGVAETPEALYSRGLAALPDLQAFVETALADEGCAAWLLAEERLELGPCLPRPGKIICIGLNYRNHAKESKMEIPTTPVLFSKFQNAVAAPGEAVPLPANSKKYDYEAELAVVIGKRARYVSEDHALEYVLGYCCANDVSERELQGKTSQWLLGKSLDKFLPLGPYLLTADEAGDPQNWPVRCWLNGIQRQNSNTADMIFSVPYLIHFISQYMTLEPGDLISTGTPEGVILGMPQPREWMKAGDSVTVEIGPLGRLTNAMVAEAQAGKQA